MINNKCSGVKLHKQRAPDVMESIRPGDGPKTISSSRYLEWSEGDMKRNFLFKR